MADVRLPSYVQKHKLAGKVTGYFWVRPQWAKPPALRHGQPCPVQSTPLGTDVATAITKANAINAAFKEWRDGSQSKLVPGSVQWLFDWYRGTEKFTELRHVTRTGYKLAMDMVVAIEMKVGRFGTRQAKLIDATASDALY